jgi:hypothetical protein
VARWNGSVWSPLGSGLVGRVRSLLATSSGAVVAGGTLALAGAPTNDNVAQWNGSSWQSLGGGMQNSSSQLQTVVFALAEFAGGLVAAGQFDVAGGVPALKVARWNGTAWSAMGGGIESSAATAVFALQRTSNGELFAGGNFGRISGREGFGLARWNGSVWAPLGALGIGNTTSAVHRTRTGEIYLGGRSATSTVCPATASRAASATAGSRSAPAWTIPSAMVRRSRRSAACRPATWSSAAPSLRLAACQHPHSRSGTARPGRPSAGGWPTP